MHVWSTMTFYMLPSELFQEIFIYIASISLEDVFNFSLVNRNMYLISRTSIVRYHLIRIKYGNDIALFYAFHCFRETLSAGLFQKLVQTTIVNSQNIGLIKCNLQIADIFLQKKISISENIVCEYPWTPLVITLNALCRQSREDVEKFQQTVKKMGFMPVFWMKYRDVYGEPISFWNLLFNIAIFARKSFDRAVDNGYRLPRGKFCELFEKTVKISYQVMFADVFEYVDRLANALAHIVDTDVVDVTENDVINLIHDADEHDAHVLSHIRKLFHRSVRFRGIIDRYFCELVQPLSESNLRIAFKMIYCLECWCYFLIIFENFVVTIRPYANLNPCDVKYFQIPCECVNSILGLKPNLKSTYDRLEKMVFDNILCTSVIQDYVFPALEDNIMLFRWLNERQIRWIENMKDCNAKRDLKKLINRFRNRKQKNNDKSVYPMKRQRCNR